MSELLLKLDNIEVYVLGGLFLSMQSTILE